MKNSSAPIGFFVDVVLDPANLCNLEKERERLGVGIRRGDKMLVFGRRNTGKTSLVKNVTGADWLNLHPSGICVYVDLYGVENLEQIVSRIGAGLAQGFRHSHPIKGSLIDLAKQLKSLRPTITVDQFGVPAVSFEFSRSPMKNIATLFEEIRRLDAAGHPVLVIFDEFQDVHGVAEAEGLLRGELQNLPGRMPVVLMGSKKHILAQMFGAPRRPFFNWGHHIEFGTVPHEAYCQYMRERFAVFNMELRNEVGAWMQDLLDGNPEAINRLCLQIINDRSTRVTGKGTHEIANDDVLRSLARLVENRRSAVEEYLRVFSPSEHRVLGGFARHSGRVDHPTGKAFLAECDLTAGGMKKILDRLLNDAVLYRDGDGFVIADPLVWRHLAAHRA